MLLPLSARRDSAAGLAPAAIALVAPLFDSAHLVFACVIICCTFFNFVWFCLPSLAAAESHVLWICLVWRGGVAMPNQRTVVYIKLVYSACCVIASRPLARDVAARRGPQSQSSMASLVFYK